MKQRTLFLSLVSVLSLASFSFAGCEEVTAGTPPATPKGPTAPAAPAPPPEEATTWSAPEAHCPQMDPGAEGSRHPGMGMGPGGPGMGRGGPGMGPMHDLGGKLADKNDSKLEVKASAKGIALESEGAPAGRVLAGIAAASKKAIHVPLTHAWVPIYASVKEKDGEALLQQVAEAAGLKLENKNGEWTAEDAHAHHMREMSAKAHEHLAQPIDSRVIAAKHPTDVARVIAGTLLSCRGHVTAVPAKGFVVVTDLAQVGERAQAVIDSLEASPAKPGKWEWAPLRNHHFAGFMQHMKGMQGMCMPHGARAPNAAAGKTFADGTAAGDFLRVSAKARKEDVVVGCGGEAPAFFVPKADQKLPELAEALGFHQLKGGGWIAMPPGAKHEKGAGKAPPPPEKGGGMMRPPPEKIELVSYQVTLPKDFAEVADGVLGNAGQAEAYLPASMVFVTTHDGKTRERFAKVLETWNKR